jgi:hypothetical protein
MSMTRKDRETAMAPRKRAAEPPPDEGTIDGETDQIPDWIAADFEGDPDWEAEETEPEPAPKARKTRKKPVPRKTEPPQDAPFQIQKHDAGQRAYGWISEWSGKKPPGPADLQAEFGAGKYIVIDASGRQARWRIHGHGPDPEGESSEPSFSAPPPPPAPPAHPFYGAAPQHSHAAPMHAPAGPDPFLHGMLARLDATVQQIHADSRRAGDEMRSLRYEIEQIPHRVGERVATAFNEANDPIESMTRLWDTTRKMADGMPAGGEEGGGGMLESAILGVLSKLGSAAPPPAAPASPPSPPPQLRAVAESPSLPGMTQEVEVELRARATASGVDYDAAVAMARAEGWTADQLLSFARQNEAQVAQ